jgi:hypothetical protein
MAPLYLGVRGVATPPKAGVVTPLRLRSSQRGVPTLPEKGSGHSLVRELKLPVFLLQEEERDPVVAGA